MKPKIITVKELKELGDGWEPTTEEDAQRIAKREGKDKIYVFKKGIPWLYRIRTEDE